MMRLLFLDFDGVLNSHAWWEKRQHERLHFDPVALDLVADLVDALDLRIVISSSWRHHRSLDQPRGLLEGVGWRHSTEIIIGKTPDQSRHEQTPWHERTGAPRSEWCRGEEIKDWLEDNWPGVPLVEAAKSIVILDDDADMGPVKHRLVQTKFEVGFTAADVVRVHALFQASEP